MSEITRLPELHFTKITLDNGLELILRCQSNLPIVAVNLWYHVGSKNEERNQRGFAHLFEHLMFEGSENYPGDFFRHLQRLGANINGSTSCDRTNYFVDLPRAHLERVLAMESDRMALLVPALDESKLRIQKDVVKNEYRQNYANRPYGMVWSLIAEALYPPSHPYSWLTIGVMEDIEAASLEDVSAFFHRYYVPGNVSLAIVGDIDLEETTSQVERYFGSISGGHRALRPWAPEAFLSESQDLLLRDRVELDRLYVVWHSVPHFHEDDAALSLLGDILSRCRASRLYQKLVIERQVAQDVACYQSGRQLAGNFGMTVTLRPGRSIGLARELIDEEIRGIVSAGVTWEELDRAVTMKTASFFFALEHMGGFGGIADRLNAYNVFMRDPSLITRDLQRFQDVTREHVQGAARTYLEGKPRVNLSVEGRKTTLSLPALDRKTPPAAAPPSTFQAPVPQVFALSNGIPVWVLPQHDLPTVAWTVALTGGASLQPPTRAGLGQISVSMMDEGTLTRSAGQIALASEAMGTGLSTHCGWDGAFVSIRCLSGFLEPSLDLMVDVLREPSFPEPEWQRLHGQTLAALKSERDSADARAYRALLSALYDENHPYRHPLEGSEPIVASLTRNEAAEFHRRYLVPGRSAVVVSGDVDGESIVRLLEKRLGAWRGPATEPPSIPTPERSPRPRILLLNRPGAAQAVVRIGHVGIARNDADFERVLLVNQVLGGQFTSRLNEKLREERGFTYGVRS